MASTQNLGAKVKPPAPASSSGQLPDASAGARGGKGLEKSGTFFGTLAATAAKANPMRLLDKDGEFQVGVPVVQWLRSGFLHVCTRSMISSAS